MFVYLGGFKNEQSYLGEAEDKRPVCSLAWFESVSSAHDSMYS